MKKFRVAILLDQGSVTYWQKEALNHALNLMDVQLILSCENNHPKRSYFQHFLYYILNFLCLKSNFTKRYPISFKAQNIKFNCLSKGTWQSLPSEIIAIILEKRIQVVIKFGMSLLKIDEQLSKIPFLSYHHGNPDKYRGRPAGFYELINFERKIGVIIQELSNKIDAGEIYAFGNSKIIHHSYRQTSKRFFSISKFLLRDAFINLSKKKPIQFCKKGKNYRLPSNFLVAKFCLILLKRKILRVFYGGFVEKKWMVGLLELKKPFKRELNLNAKKLTKVPFGRSHIFLADPFFSHNGEKLRVEALNRYTGLGEILEIKRNNLSDQKVILTGRHYSYPISTYINGKEFLLPEVASHSKPYLLKKGKKGLEKIFLKGLENKRLVDSTIFKKGESIFIFFGLQDNSDDILHLYYANSLRSRFKRHPESPVRIDPEGARMGGRVLIKNNRLLRLGQDNCYKYGQKLKIYEIVKINHKSYKERLIGSIGINDFEGPHTLDIYKDTAVIDFYEEKISLLAWYRRIIARLIQKRF